MTQKPLFESAPAGWARLSEDRLCRFVLGRFIPQERAGGLVKRMLVIMLNPSTADETVDGQTIKRCMGFAMREGAEVLVVCNLSPWRTAYPSKLWADKDKWQPRQPENMRAIATEIVTCEKILVAWGSHGARTEMAGMKTWLVGAATAAGKKLWCLGVTNNGQPKHPLYIKADQPLEDLGTLATTASRRGAEKGNDMAKDTGYIFRIMRGVAFQTVDLGDMSDVEIRRVVSGHTGDPHWLASLIKGLIEGLPDAADDPPLAAAEVISGGGGQGRLNIVDPGRFKDGIWVDGQQVWPPATSHQPPATSHDRDPNDTIRSLQAQLGTAERGVKECDAILRQAGITIPVHGPVTADWFNGADGVEQLPIDEWLKRRREAAIVLAAVDPKVRGALQNMAATINRRADEVEILSAERDEFRDRVDQLVKTLTESEAQLRRLREERNELWADHDALKEAVEAKDRAHAAAIDREFEAQGIDDDLDDLPRTVGSPTTSAARAVARLGDDMPPAALPAGAIEAWMPNVNTILLRESGRLYQCRLHESIPPDRRWVCAGNPAVENQWLLELQPGSKLPPAIAMLWHRGHLDHQAQYRRSGVVEVAGGGVTMAPGKISAGAGGSGGSSSLTPPPTHPLPPALADVLLERIRQMNDLGFTPNVDDELNERELVLKAVARCVAPGVFARGRERDALVEAASLLVAEIERMDRAHASLQRGYRDLEKGPL